MIVLLGLALLLVWILVVGLHGLFAAMGNRR